MRLTGVVAGGGVHVTVGAASFSPAEPQQLPAPPPDFTGRAEAAAAVEEGLLQGSRRVGVVGPAGAGKSALAVYVAHRLRDRFPDGCFYIDLRTSTSASTVELAATMLHSLGVPPDAVPTDPAACIGMYRSETAGRCILLVIDNLDRPIDVGQLVPVGENSALLVASRNAESTVEGLRLVRIAEMKEEEAAELLLRASGREPPAVPTDPDEGLTLVTRCCGALPLALRICGTLLASRPHWSFGRLAEYLREERERLDRLRVGDLAVRASFNLSMRELDPDAAEVFRLAGAIPGPLLTSPLVSRLRGDDDRGEAEALLDGLVARSLVEPLGAGIYWFHELLGLFAREEFEASRDEEAQRDVLERIVSWHADMFGAAMSVLLRPSEQRGATDPDRSSELLAEIVTGLDVHSLNVDAVLNQARELGMHLEASRLAHIAGDLARRRWTWRTTEHFYRAAHEAAMLTDHAEAQFATLMDLASCMGMQGRHDDAVASYERAMAIARDNGLERYEAAAIGTLASEYAEAGELDRAARLHKESLEGHRAAGDAEGQARQLMGLGAIDHRRGRLRSAARQYEEALALAPLDMPPAERALLFANIGIVNAQRGRLAEARHALEQALVLNRAGADVRSEVKNLGALFNVELMAGDHARAIELCDELLELETGLAELDTTWASLPLLIEGGVPAALGSQVVTLAERAVPHLVILDQAGRAIVLAYHAALLAGALHNGEAVVRLLAVCAAIDAPEPVFRGPVAAAMTLLGAVHLRCGRFDVAADLLQQAERAWVELGDRTEQARAAAALADAYAATGRQSEKLAALGRVGQCISALGKDADMDVGAVMDWFVHDPWLNGLVET